MVFDSNSCMICSDCYGCSMITDIEVAVSALCFALQNIHNWRLNSYVKTILSSSAKLITAIQLDSLTKDWRLEQQIQNIKILLVEMESPSFHSIPLSWNRVAHALALHGLQHHEVSLFHRGQDLPRWLMKILGPIGCC